MTLFYALWAAVLKRAAAALRPHWPPPRPHCLTATMVQAVYGAHGTMAIQYTINFVPSPDADVTTYEVTAVVNGTPAVTTYPAASTPSTAPITFPLGAAVSLTRVDITGLGLRSVASAPLAIVVPNVPPTPGPLTVTVVGVVPDPTPAPAPIPTPTPAPTPTPTPAAK